MTFNWQVNVVDVFAVFGVAFLLYGRLVDIETKIKVLWSKFESDMQHRKDT